MRWKFEPDREPETLRDVERRLAECAADGSEFDGADVATDAGFDPETKRLKVPADFLADVLLSRVSGLVADPRGVRLANCHITGKLDLSRAAMQAEQVDRAVLPLACRNVDFEEPPAFDYATTGAIAFTGCRLPGFRARGADIAAELTLDDCTFYRRRADVVPAYRKIDLDGATIGGDFHARRLRYEDDYAEEREQTGPPSTEERNPPGPVPFAHILIDADNCKIAGGVDLSFLVDGTARTLCTNDPEFAVLMGNFDNADVFGDFRAVGAKFAPTLQRDRASDAIATDRYPKCLDLRGAHIRGDVELDYIQTSGEVRLEDATLTQDLAVGGARLVNVENDVEPEAKCAKGWSGAVIEAAGLAVGGSVHLVDRRDTFLEPEQGKAKGSSNDPGEQKPTATESARQRSDGRLVAIGTIRLTRARITGDFDASGATICAVGLRVEGVALDMRSAEVGGTIFLDGRRDVGPGLFIGLVNLINSKVSGSVILSGSWFRAPAGQQMGPQRIHLPVLEDSPDRPETFGTTENEWSSLDRAQIARTDRELEDWQRNKLWRTCRSAARPSGERGENPVTLAEREFPFAAPPTSSLTLTILGDLGIRGALELSRRQLWRLRGGCRAIAMVDAQVTGSVLFGIGPIAWRDNSVPESDVQLKEGYDGPSVVVGCVDLDRVRIDGNLRLTGGVFRALTPVVPEKQRGETAIGHEHKPAQRGASGDGGPPDVSLSNPSTPGWTELKARVCLSLRSAGIQGRLETKYFGPIPRPDLNSDNHSAPPKFLGNGWPSKDDISDEIKELRGNLHIIPDFADLCKFLQSIKLPDQEKSSVHGTASFNDPSKFVDELVMFLDLASAVESTDDKSLGATLPALPTVHKLAGWYPLRPDGLFDLSGANLQSIHDHPCHGWPTSDGHLELNGCTYNYLTFNHDPSYRLAPNSERRSKRVRPDGPTERRGTSVGWRFFIWLLWRVLIAYRCVVYVLLSIPYWACRGACWLGLTDREPPRCSKLWPGHASESHRLYTIRYIDYAVASFRIRNDDSCSPEDRRIKWLEQQYPGAGPRKQDFRPQPYEQLAQVMRATGFSLDADGIAAAKRNMRWRAGVFGFVQRAFDIGLWLTCKYTYSPTRIFCFLVALLFLGVLISGAAYDRGMLASEQARAEFSPWMYATDLIVPIVEFGYVNSWRVTEPSVACFCSEADWHVVCERPAICDTGPSDIQGSNKLGRSMAAAGTWLMDTLQISGARALEWALGLITGFGALFTALAVITFTGVMRRD